MTAVSGPRVIGRGEGGEALVEFALVLPLFALLFVSMIDLGLALYTRAQTQTAAQAGINYAGIKAFDAAGISTAATSATSAAITVAPPTWYYACDVNGALISQGTSAAPCASGFAAAKYASVTVNATYSPILSVAWKALTGSRTLQLSITAIGPTS